MKKIRLSHIFLIINLTILSMPIIGIVLLNLYDNSLIREAESELITQAVILSNVYKRVLIEQSPDLDIENYGLALAKEYWQKEDPQLGKWRPLPATLNLFNDEILAPAPAPIASELSPDPVAMRIGALLEDLLKETQLTTLAGIRIIDINGIIVASTGWTKYRSLLSQQDVQQALKGVTTKSIRKKSPEEDAFFSPLSRSTDIKLYVTHPIILEKRIVGAVHLLRTPANVLQDIYQNRRLYTAFAIVLLAGIAIISLFMAYTITKPIKALVEQAKKATNQRQLQLQPLTQPVTAEFELLSNTLVTMVDKQAARAEQINNFASYVSHEFKTPISSINGAADILLEHKNDLTEKEHHRFLTMISENCQRMTLLMQQLTDLAKADNLSMSEKAVNLLNIIQKQVAIYHSQLTSITLNANSSAFPVLMNEELLTSVVVNLFENVIQHGGDEVQIKLSIQDNHIVFDFIDNGDGISAQNAKRIFEPFFTTTKKNGGTGLGLAIIQTLLYAHSGSIELIPYNTTGCQFRIKLPLFSSY